ncbi:TRM11 family SAM-dependent methyltransferase [Micromonospora pattaloongensis]|uniref:TRM11 family SAM-dependent methyltransferase n=1 Tax=Micromonospora pattaloongensis TaxID=405436 RepID=UPI000B85E7C2|nr:SAM-dependent methyltransferase [Micromonospora pattaloongensis]
MTDYALLILPSTNRVYAEASVRLTMSELMVFNRQALDGRIGDIATETIGGVPYVTFRAHRLDERDVALLANLSARYALYAREGELLRPLTVRPLDRFDSDLLTIQKYVGKTNEQFTKLLLNATVLATDAGPEMTERRLRVLDPMCGRGTTLNQAMMYGYDAAGLDVDAKDVEAYATFIRTWLKNKRLKHRAELTTVRRQKSPAARRLHVVVGASKEEYRAGEVIDVSMINADTRRGREFFKAGSFDAVVTDAPYGVQHGSRAEQGRLSRTPLGLLAEAIPVWAELVRPGGAVGISWNTLVGPRAELAALLTAAGLEVLDGEGYADFAHRVDQAIVRDLIVARRP